MKLTDNTILITGGGSGIGLGLAQAFQALGNKVIVATRSAQRLGAAKAAGFPAYEVDMTKPASIAAMAKQVLKEHPALNAVIQNAGIMQAEDLKKGDSQQVIDDTIFTNLIAPMHLNNALIPHLLKKDTGFIMTVTSGLAFMPMAMFPTYCATKAAVHSYSQSLRYQLKGTPIQVIELAPPYVQTPLTGAHQESDPNAMPLNDFIKEVMAILKNKPDVKEVLVERVNFLRLAEGKGVDNYYTQFDAFNDQMSGAR
ncbi:MAG: SDR family oxidoreductase [Leptospirales bacterium]|nr:SDR family oxidoreductase [Leptospirales bacterium]